MSEDGLQLGRRQMLAAGFSAAALSVATSAVAQSTRRGSGAPARMPPIIDVHAHAILPSWYEWLARKNAPGPPRMEGIAVPQWSPELAIRVMDEHNIRCQILSNSIGTKGMTAAEAVPLARRMNEELAGFIARHPGRFGAFAVIPVQDVEASVREIAYALKTLHLDGVCLPTSHDGLYPGDPRFEPIWAELDRQRAVAFVHPHAAPYTAGLKVGVVPGMVEFMFDSTRAVISVVVSGTRRKYPNFKYIATHGGGTLPFIAERAAYVTEQSATYASMYTTKLSFDQVMEEFRSFHYDLAFATSAPALAAIKAFVPVSQLLMGFDFPFVTQATIAPAIDAVTAEGVFTNAELAAIATDNPLRLLPSLAARLSARR